MKKDKADTGGIVQLVERSSSMHQALGLVPSTKLTECGSSYLQFQYSGNEGRKVRGSRLSLAIQQIQGQPALDKIFSTKTKQNTTAML